MPTETETFEAANRRIDGDTIAMLQEVARKLRANEQLSMAERMLAAANLEWTAVKTSGYKVAGREK